MIFIMKDRKNYVNCVRDHLISGKTITQNEALTLFGAGRLADIILTLRRRGINIETIMEPHKTRNGATSAHARYRLVQATQPKAA